MRKVEMEDHYFEKKIVEYDGPFVSSKYTTLIISLDLPFLALTNQKYWFADSQGRSYIGFGEFGHIFKVKNESGRIFAMKIVKLNKYSSKVEALRSIREVRK